MTPAGLVAVAAGCALAVLGLAFALAVARLLRGPGEADRFVALDMLTGIAVAAGALVAILTGRREFLDVAFGLGVFGFVGTCALASFLERRERRP